MFSKKCPENILSMRLTKCHKSENGKNKKIIFNNFKVNL